MSNIILRTKWESNRQVLWWNHRGEWPPKNHTVVSALMVDDTIMFRLLLSTAPKINLNHRYKYQDYTTCSVLVIHIASLQETSSTLLDQCHNYCFSHPSNFCDTFENQLINMQNIIRIKWCVVYAKRKTETSTKIYFLFR